MWARLARNAGSSVGGFLVHFVAAFFLFPFTVSHIGAGSYGILVLAGAVVGYSGLLSFGLRPTLVKLSAEHLERGDRDAFHRVTGQILLIYSGVAIFLLTVAALGAWLLPFVLNVAEERVDLFRVVLGLLAVQGAVSLPGTVWTGLVEGLEDYHFAAVIRVAGEGLKVVGTVVLLLSGYGLVSLVVAYLLIAVLQFVAGWWWIRRRLPWARIRPIRGTRGELVGLMRFSGLMFLMSFSGSSENVADKLILGSFTSPALVTLYEVGNRLSTFGHQLIVQIARVLVPTASALYTRRDRAALRSVLLTASRSVVFAHGMLVVGMLAFGREFIDLWMGPGYEDAYAVLVLLMLAAFAAAHATVPDALCYGTGHLGVIATVSVGRMLLNVGLSVILVFQWGVVGVAAATLVSRGLQTLILMPYFSRLFHVGLGVLLWKGFIRAWLSLGIAAGVAVILREKLLHANWVSLAGVSVLTAIAGAGAFWIVSLSGPERKRLRSMAAARLGTSRG